VVLLSTSIIVPKFTERTSIRKYAKGVDPTTGSPFEIIEGPAVHYEGTAAIKRLAELGYDISKYNNKEGC
jgi:hypothetical protein